MLDIVKLDYPNYEVGNAFINNIARAYLYGAGNSGVENIRNRQVFERRQCRRVYVADERCIY